jgi:microcystin-dependent protein
MHRIDEAGHASNMFTVGNPATATPATVLGSDWPNAVQEEIIAVLTQAGASPIKGTNTQLRDAILTLVAAAGAPIGTVREWAGTLATIPAGHLLCNGAAVSRTTYATLFAALGTKYGSGDGSTTFNLPSLAAKYVGGAANDGELGTSVGNNNVTPTLNAAGSHNHGGTVGGTALSTAQMPPHTHDYSGLIATASHETGTGSNEARGSVTTQATTSTGSGATHNHTISTQADHNHTANSQDNRPSTVLMYKIIRSL